MLKRLTLYLLVCALLAAAATFGGARRRPVMSPEVARRLDGGARFADSLTRALRHTPAESISAGSAIAAGYLTRVRLGLGSPFRLVDYALRDPLLADSLRPVVGYAILARVMRGDAYRVDPAALEPIGDPAAADGGRVHRAVIDSVVSAARDPRSGELAVRVAYRAALVAGDVGRRAPVLATQAAAMARDRVLAQRDVAALLAEARALAVDPLELLALWRESRRFTVERPILDAPGGDIEREALVAVPRLIERLDSLGKTPSAHDTASAVVAQPLLPEGAAQRLAWLAASRAAPPQAPVAVALNGYARAITTELSDPQSRMIRTRFVANSRNEETLAAEFALLTARSDSGRTAPAMAVMWAAVSLRAYAQETVWFPGDGGPTVPELKTTYGLASVSFDRSVPTRWRPYFLRMLAISLDDLRRVMPSLDVTGLGVHFGNSPLRDAALAMHDPATRTIFLPLASSAGVIAHEVAHDLDWQAARTRYGTRGTYSTDRAVREYRDRLAASVLELAGAEQAGPRSGPGASQRPTEVFARSVDWFVTASLARAGRTNGYLSALQDDQITGYAAVTSPEVAREAGAAMIRALDEMTVLPDSTRSWFSDAYGRGRVLPAFDAVRRVLEAPISLAELRRTRTLGLDWARPSADASLNALMRMSGGECSSPGQGADAEATTARRRVLALAAEARARGIVRRRANYARTNPSAPARLRALHGQAWDPGIAESMLREVRDAVLNQVVVAEASRSAWAIVMASPDGIGRGCT